ncbi:alpha/beta fold hydrolase [Streptomyces sp. NPDC102462]|uniref:alpha/beta fold hydrolase n=1 Tax=Streptomyces sp. NPDC102462 TaxID=3366178 RepID=UPI003823B0A2
MSTDAGPWPSADASSAVTPRVPGEPACEARTGRGGQRGPDEADADGTASESRDRPPSGALTGQARPRRPGEPAGGGMATGLLGFRGQRTATVRLRRAALGGSVPVRVLLLHGLAGSTSVWRSYEELALDGVEIWDGVLPWGAEGDPGWSVHGDPAEHVQRALNAVPGEVDAVIVHSFTAGPALEVLARRTPEGRGPRAAVVVAPFHRRSPGDFTWDDALYYLSGFHRILEEGLRIGAGDRVTPALRAAMAMRVRDRIGPYGWQQFFGAYLRSPHLDVAALRLPVLVVAGTEDFAAPPDDARTLAGALPDGRFELFGECGHFAMAEQPRRFADAVHALLSEVFPDRLAEDTAATAVPRPPARPAVHPFPQLHTYAPEST